GEGPNAKKGRIMARRNKMVTGVFRNRVDADRAFDRLLELGYLESEISVLMSETTRANYYATTDGRRDPEGKLKAAAHAGEGRGVGATVGTAVGAATAGSAALAGVFSISTVVFPPIGAFTPIIAGPIVAALAGGGAGAVAGGFLGALVGFGIPEQNVKAYE